MKSLSLSKPHVIVMTGLPGSGKSFFAEKFAETFNAPFVSQVRMQQVSNADPKTVERLINYQLDELFKTKQSIVFDGHTETRAERTELAQKAQKAGYKTLLVWIQTDSTTSRNRATKNYKERTSPVITNEEYDARVRRFSAPDPLESPIVISGKHTYASQAKVVLKRLSAPRAEESTRKSPQPPTRPSSPDRPTRRTITIR